MQEKLQKITIFLDKNIISSYNVAINHKGEFMEMIMTGKEIREWRLSKGITQRFLANKFNIAFSTLNKIENEKISGLNSRIAITQYIQSQK